MPNTSNDGNRRPGSDRPGSDAFVLFAMALVSAAVGCGVYLHLGEGKLAGIGFAFATYMGLFRLHRWKISLAGAAAANVEARRQRGEVAHSLGGNPGRNTGHNTGHSHDTPRASLGASERALADRTLRTPPPANAPAAAKRRDSADTQDAQLRAVPKRADQKAGAGSDAKPDEDSTGLSALQSYWAYRPTDHVPRMPQHPVAGPPPGGDAHSGSEKRDQRMAKLKAPATPQAPPPAAPAAPTLPQAALREADVEMIQGLIKKLADEVNAAEAFRPSGADTPAAPALMKASAAAHEPQRPQPSPDANVEASLDALRITAETMRHAAARSNGRPAATRTGHEAPRQEEAPLEAPPPVKPGHLKLAGIADAIHSKRIDVMLEPLIGLGDLRARHYEVSIRLHDPAGGSIATDISDPELANTSLLPLIDRTRLDRAISVSRRLGERGKSGAVFSDYSGEALTDTEFRAGAAEGQGDDAAPATPLVLAFAQSDVRQLSEAQWDGLRELNAMGFRFAIGAVTDLDIDFERLAETGFEFVKLDAVVFLEGLQGPHGIIPASDICAYLGRLGFALIAGHIDSEYERAQLFGFGVAVGQGSLFGGPRSMKADALSAARTAAA